MMPRITIAKITTPRIGTERITIATIVNIPKSLWHLMRPGSRRAFFRASE
jgi:hypothetical protein